MVAYPLIVDSFRKRWAQNTITYININLKAKSSQKKTLDKVNTSALEARGLVASFSQSEPLVLQWEEVETRRALRKGSMGRGNLTLFYVIYLECNHKNKFVDIPIALLCALHTLFHLIPQDP